MITPVQVWNDQFLPEPDVVRQSASLGGANYAIPTGFSAHGRQATFDLFTRGRTDRGLRVMIERASLVGPASDGVLATVTRINGDALDASYTVADRTFEINVQNATTMANLKTEVDGETNISSVYFGGETGTGLCETNLPTSTGGVNGAQGTFDIIGDSQTDQGLRVTIERGTHRLADETNGFRVTFTTGTTDVDLTSANRIVELTFPDASTLATMKTAIDNVSGLDSSYFGGESGTSAIADVGARPDLFVSGGTHDIPATLQIPARSGRAYINVILDGLNRLISGAAANGYRVVLTRSNAATSPSVALSTGDKTITGDLRDDTSLGELAELIGALSTSIRADVQGGSPNDLAEASGALSAGGGPDPHAWVRVRTLGDIYIAQGTATPTSNDNSVLARSGYEWRGVLDPGQSLYIRRVGGTNVRASAEMWTHHVA